MNGKQADLIVAEAQRARWSITAIAAHIGCTRPTLYYWRDNADVRVSRALARNLETLRAELPKEAPR